MAAPNPLRLFLRLRTVVWALVISVPLFGLWWLELESETPEVGAFFSGVLNLLSIATGFLASFYFFVVSRSTAFLKEIDSTNTFNGLLVLTSFSLRFSIVVIALTFVLSVLYPYDTGKIEIDAAIPAVWLFLIALTAMNFSRCISLFISVAK